MTRTLFTDLEQLAAQALRENERMCARIAQLEHQLAVCQADRDRAREAGERLAGACEATRKEAAEIREWCASGQAVRANVRELIQTNAALIIDIIDETLADWRGQQTGEPEGEE